MRCCEHNSHISEPQKEQEYILRNLQRYVVALARSTLPTQIPVAGCMDGTLASRGRGCITSLWNLEHVTLSNCNFRRTNHPILDVNTAEDYGRIGMTGHMTTQRWACSRT